MTSYFDNAAQDAREVFHGEQSEEAQLGSLRLIEADVIRDVSLVAGDREFPDDFRERIMATIAQRQVESIAGIENPAALDDALMIHGSPLIGELHQLFHALASRRVQTRFGVLTDKPEDILKRRSEYDEEVTP